MEEALSYRLRTRPVYAYRLHTSGPVQLAPDHSVMAHAGDWLVYAETGHVVMTDTQFRWLYEAVPE